MLGGKTRICNELAGKTFAEPPAYAPTVGVRILEVERDLVVGSRSQNITIEVWDCSGDQNYENCWPAILKGLNGIIVVFDPTSKSQASDVKIWCDWFCTNGNLKAGQVAIFAHGSLTTKHRPLAVKLGMLLTSFCASRRSLSCVFRLSCLSSHSPAIFLWRIVRWRGGDECTHCKCQHGTSGQEHQCECGI